jgi:integrase
MSVYLRGRIWWTYLYRPGAKPLQVSTGCDNKEDALAVEATLRRAAGGKTKRDRLIAALDNILGAEDTPAGIPLARVWEVYTGVSNLGTVAKTTMQARRLRVAHFLAWVEVNWPAARTIQEVSRQCAFGYLEHLRGIMSGKTYNNARGDLSAVWGALLVRAELAENVWRIMPTADAAGRERRAFTVEEENRLLEACRSVPPWWHVSIIARHTGLRKSDILFLKWENISQGVIRLTPKKTARHKTRVTIPIHPRVQAALDDLLQAGPWLFPELATGGDRARDTVYRGILKAAGLHDEKYILDFHCWRHTFRTRLRDAGVSVEVCNRLGGWSDQGEGDKYDHAIEPFKAAIAADTVHYHL